MPNIKIAFNIYFFNFLVNISVHKTFSETKNCSCFVECKNYFLCNYKDNYIKEKFIHKHVKVLHTLQMKSAVSVEKLQIVGLSLILWNININVLSTKWRYWHKRILFQKKNIIVLNDFYHKIHCTISKKKNEILYNFTFFVRFIARNQNMHFVRKWLYLCWPTFESTVYHH